VSIIRATERGDPESKGGRVAVLIALKQGHVGAERWENERKEFRVFTYSSGDPLVPSHHRVQEVPVAELMERFRAPKDMRSTGAGDEEVFRQRLSSRAKGAR